MKHIGLFEGIGGFSLAARWMGWETVAWCEWNEFCQKVLSYHFPNAIGHGDITKTDFTIYRGKCDILTGGFPCQPYSTAGKRLGKADDRHLWPSMLRAIQEIQPRWVVGENVRGIINWNAGMVFDEVQADLETAGYEVVPFLLPAAGVGAPHRRDRVWFVAYANGGVWECGKGGTGARYEQGQKRETSTGATIGRHGLSQPTPHPDSERHGQEHGFCTRRQMPEKCTDAEWNAADTDSAGRAEECDTATQPGKQERQHCKTHIGSEPRSWQNFPTQSPVCSGNDGLPTESLRQRIREDSMGYLSEEEIDKILSAAYTEWRNETIKAGGNAIVPQVFLQICKAIESFENQVTSQHQ